MTKTAFQELGFANADELATKSQLIRFVAAEIKSAGSRRRLLKKFWGWTNPMFQP